MIKLLLQLVKLLELSAVVRRRLMHFTLLYSHFIDKYVAVAHDLNGFLEILLARDQCQFGMTSFDVLGGRFIERLPVQVVVIFASLRHEV